MGHAMGAAGVLEAVGCVLTLTRDRIPPTANYEAADPACLLDVVHGAPREARVETVVNNSIGFGGANAVVVLRRTDESACPVPEGSAT
jgi:3-oxoacyl-(acyl-carrier-protein) synthase